jgi:hypothetical protein
VSFDVVYRADQPRFCDSLQGRVYAYLNRCAHVPMEMDYQAGRFFDDSGAGCCVPPTARPMNLTPGCARAGPAAAGW